MISFRLPCESRNSSPRGGGIAGLAAAFRIVALSSSSPEPRGTIAEALDAGRLLEAGGDSGRGGGGIERLTIGIGGRLLGTGGGEGLGTGEDDRLRAFS